MLFLGCYLSWYLFCEFFIYSGIKLLSEIWLEKMFSTSVGCRITDMMVSFAAQKHFGFQWCHLSTVGLNAYKRKVLFRESFPVYIFSSTFPSILSSRFVVSGFMLIPLVSWSWVLLSVRNKDTVPFLCMLLSSLTRTTYWRFCPFPVWILGPILTIQIVAGVWACLWVLGLFND